MDRIFARAPARFWTFTVPGNHGNLRPTRNENSDATSRTVHSACGRLPRVLVSFLLGVGPEPSESNLPTPPMASSLACSSRQLLFMVSSLTLRIFIFSLLIGLLGTNDLLTIDLSTKPSVPGVVRCCRGGG